MVVSNSNTLKHTPLHDLHQALGARMVPFAGYSLPVQFEGVKTEHLHTRKAAGLFDVSHMGQILVRGENAAEKLESLMPANLVDLPEHKQVYTLFTNDRGGILDDLLICRLEANCFMLVVNAACKEDDLTWLHENLNDLDIQPRDNQALLALQGPAAAPVLGALVPAVEPLAFMQGCHADLDGCPLYITRSGYTGEDGFEISLPAGNAEAIARQLLAHAEVKPAGLGARDTLRLEAGLCLYGHDLNETITPVSANLTWCISKARREGGSRAGGFPGAETILQEISLGTLEKRVGLTVNGKAPVREGAQLVDEHNKLIGSVTSGGYAPSLNAPVAMAYIQSAYTDIGTEVNAIVRGRSLPVTVASLPFVPHQYAKNS